MNNKEIELNRIASTVILCCKSEDEELNIEIIKGKSRKDSVIMTRCILARQVISAGYAISTASRLLNRTERDVRRLLEKDLLYMQTSRAYRIASAEVTLLCRDIIGTQNGQNLS